MRIVIANAPASTPTERRGYNFTHSRLVATSLCRGASVPNAPTSTPTERRGYNFTHSRLVATSLCRGAAEPNAPTSTPTERRGYNFTHSRLVATSLCRGAAGPSAPASTPTERRGYNFSSSRLVATSLCRGAAGPSAPASTPSPLSRARLHCAVASNVSLGSSEPNRLASTSNSRRRMNSPFPVNCDISSLAGNGGFNRRQFIPSAPASTPTKHFTLRLFNQ
jgi:hypothetical protein